MALSPVKSICILTTVHPAFDVRIFHKEAKTLNKAGYDVTLIAQHDKYEIVDGIKIIALPKPKNRCVRMTKTVWLAYWKALKIDADIYHFHDPELMPIAWLLKLHGKKVIYDMHESLPKQIKNKPWINSWCRNFISILAFYGERFLLIGTPLIFAEYSYRKDYPWVRKYIIVLNMPLLTQLLPFKGDTGETQSFSIGYLGRVMTERGVLTVIEALKILKIQGIEPRFECIGYAEKSDLEQLLKLCEEYNLHDVNFHGYLPADKGWHIIGQCAIGLAVLHPVPNYIESYPTKIFEYMAMELPVIASNFPLYQEIVEGAECGICVDPLNPEEIAKAIQFILEHSAEAKQMGKNGRRAVKERYNWRFEEKKLLGLYNKIMQRR